jgi:ABC-type antimicrobial peptide transport system permease subunit
VSQFAIRVDSEIGTVASLVRRAVTDLSANLAVQKLETLREQVDASIVTERLMGNLSSVLAAMSTLLAAIGLYGLLAFIVTLRTREIAIRTALGATRADIMTMVFRSAIGLLVAGMLVGLPVALWSHAVARALTPNLGDASLPSTAVGAAIVAVTLIVAAMVPARRASRIHLVEALRDC